MKNKLSKLLIVFTLAACLVLPACGGIIDTGKNEFAQTVLTGAIGDFNIISPAEGAADFPFSPVIKWQKAANAERYDVEICDRSDFDFTEPGSYMYKRQGIVGEELALAGELDWESAFYLRVRARNSDSAKLSPAVRFTTGADAAARDDILIDDFSVYANTAELRAAYMVLDGGNPIGVSLAQRPGGTAGDMAMRLDYDVSDWYSTVMTTVGGRFHGALGIGLWVRANPVAGGSAIEMAIDLVERGGEGFRTRFPLVSNKAEEIKMPFTAFTPHIDASSGFTKVSFDVRNLTQIRIALVGGSNARGACYIDDIKLLVGGFDDFNGQIDDFDSYGWTDFVTDKWLFSGNMSDSYVVAMNGVLEFGYTGGVSPAPTLERRINGKAGFDTLSVTAAAEGDHTVCVRFYTGTDYYTVILNDYALPPSSNGDPGDMDELLIPLSEFWFGESGNEGSPVTGGLLSENITGITIYIFNWDTSQGVRLRTWFDDIRLI